MRRLEKLPQYGPARCMTGCQPNNKASGDSNMGTNGAHSPTTRVPPTWRPSRTGPGSRLLGVLAKMRAEDVRLASNHGEEITSASVDIARLLWTFRHRNWG